MTIEVVTFRVLIKQEDVVQAKQVKTSIPGFVTAVSDEKREQQAHDKGVIVQVGPTAFNDYGTEPPKVGERVCYAKFAGKEIVDPDTNEMFVVINDEDIVAILRKTINE